jgi:hypothetical protein
VVTNSDDMTFSRVIAHRSCCPRAVRKSQRLGLLTAPHATASPASLGWCLWSTQQVPSRRLRRVPPQHDVTHADPNHDTARGLTAVLGRGRVGRPRLVLGYAQPAIG